MRYLSIEAELVDYDHPEAGMQFLAIKDGVTFYVAGTLAEVVREIYDAGIVALNADDWDIEGNRPRGIVNG